MANFSASWIERSHKGYTRFTRGQPAFVFNHIHYSISSSAWVFPYQRPPAANLNPLEESAREQYVAGASC